MANSAPIKIDAKELIRSIKDLTDSVKKHTRVVEENNRLRKAELSRQMIMYGGGADAEIPAPPEGDGS